MRVSDNGSNPLQGAGVGGPDRSQGTQGVNGGGDSRRGRVGRGDGDSVQLSSLGQALQAEDVESPERAQRVDELKSDLQNGRYSIDAEGLSRKLISDALNGGLGE